MSTNFPDSPHTMRFAAFPVLREVDGKTHVFPI